MTPAPLLERLGLAGDRPDRRLVAALIAAALALYAIGYVAFPPAGPTNDDEDLYLEQTLLWLDTGSFRTEKIDPLTGRSEPFVPGDYPPGMIALMAPFVTALGRAGAFVPSLLCLLLAVVATARWLRDEGRSPIFALLLLGFPALLVGGRLAMSDVARTAATAVGLWLFFRGIGRGPGWWLASGFVAGSALSLRESAVLPFIPFFAGTVLRRDRGWGWLLLGGLAGTGLHLALTQAAFGDPFFVRGDGTPYRLALATVPERLPLYLLGLLVFVPGGLLLGLAYRGRRRTEVLLTIGGIFLFYLLQAYGMTASGFLKRLVVALRYFDPLLPVLAFAMAESVPRWLGARRMRSAGLARGLGAVASLWLAGVLTVSFAVHPVLAGWGAGQESIRATIERAVPRDAVLITNGTAVRKFVDDLARPYHTLVRHRITPEDVHTLLERHREVSIVFLDRTDSAYWRDDAEQNEAFVARLGAPLPIVDEQVTPTDRLRIWRLEGPDR